MLSQHRVHRRATSVWTIIVLSLGWWWFVAGTSWRRALAVDSDSSATDLAFFETHIRPVLIKHCYECHASDAEDIGGAFLADSADGMRVGGESGPAIVPGDVEASVLISALRYESSEMPPEGKLPNAVIANFETWIERGAIDPRTDVIAASRVEGSFDWDSAREFWAFQPLRAPHVPITIESNGDTTAANPIDAFISGDLRQAGVIANERATAEVQLRRLCFDLTGLPPTSDQMRTFLADPSESRWRSIVDDLLASPEFARQWARHWMDVARYADSNGGDFNATFHDAWRYRDYLIRRLAADTPIDQIIREQVAGDLLPANSDQDRSDQIIATTFLMLGSKMLSERDKAKLTMDVVDEQIDTVGRAFLGMTLGCARCHDHKFDPVPTEDYYALAGIFKSTQSLHGESQQYVSTWQPTPLPVDESILEAIETYRIELQQLESSLEKDRQQVKELDEARRGLGIWIDDVDADRVGNWTVSTYTPGFIGPHYVHDNNANKGDCQITFATNQIPAGHAELRIWYSAGDNRSSMTPIQIEAGAQSYSYQLDQRRQDSNGYHKLAVIDIPMNVTVKLVISNEGTDGYTIADAVQWVPVNDAGEPIANQKDEVNDTLQVKRDRLAERIKQNTKRLSQLKANAPPPRPTAMAVCDASTDRIGDCRVHIRGEVNNLGDVVPRGFLRALSNGAVEFGSGSGRLELAWWLTDPDQPLTPRVMVNRVWSRLFGQGLVRSVDNFGVRGDRPSHPELLDYLATTWVRDKWHLKPLVREIVLTETYRRSSKLQQRALAIDPENRLLWRAHRKRLTAEMIRDAALVAAGQLDHGDLAEPMKNHGVLVRNNNASSKAKSLVGLDDRRRTMFLPVVRNEVAKFLINLDFVNPDLLTGQRPLTNVPTQALTLIGSPEIQRWAAQTTQRMMRISRSDDERLSWLVRRLWHRDVQERDRELFHGFIRSRKDMTSASQREHAWQQWTAAMMAATEFRYLD